MVPLDDAEFSAKFFAESSALGKIKLAVREERYTVLVRTDKPNLPDEFIWAVLDLPDNFKVSAERRKTTDPNGLSQVYELKRVPYKEMGTDFELYIKGYFRKSGNFVVEFLVQSLRQDI